MVNLRSRLVSLIGSDSGHAFLHLDLGVDLGVDLDIDNGLDPVKLKWTVVAPERREPTCVLVVLPSVPQKIPAGGSPLLARRSSDTPPRSRPPS